MTSRGRALSSLGQFYAFKRDPKALQYFEEALKEFGTDQGNNQITLSHLLNFASDQGDIDLYEKYAPSYFEGNSTIYRQLVYLEENNRVGAFGFYTYVKAINALYIDKIDNDLLQRLLFLDFEKLEYNTRSHLWQLIYKNIGMILYKIGQKKLAIKYMDKALNCIPQPSGTILAINRFNNIQNLENWVKTFFQKDRGIFLLQMERGMGKTTFYRVLDELDNHNIKLKDINVRTYYFNDTYRSKTATFALELNNILKRGKPAKNNSLGYEIEGIHTGLENKKEAMVDLLKTCSRKRSISKMKLG